MMLFLSDVVFIFLSCLLIINIFMKKHRKLPLPPGPKGFPVIGNIWDMPTGPEGPFWAKHKDLYGPISSLNTLGQTIIILNDAHLAFELLDKKSSRFSNRPQFVFGGELCGLEDSLSFLQYGERFRAVRKLIHKFMGTRTSVSRFEPVEEAEARRMMWRILKEPKKFTDHFRTMAGAIILMLTYGYSVKPDGSDPLVKLIDTLLQRFSYSTQAGAWLVDLLPFLKHFPEWLPGMQFKKTAREWKAHNMETLSLPFEFVQKQMISGTAFPSFGTMVLEEDMSENEQNIHKWTLGNLYGGGADTTASALSGFILAMVLYPSVLQRAQQEIDAVIGPDRLPGFADRVDLPYINAIVKEVLRWGPVAPTGVPHVPTEDDFCAGYFIPKGSIIIANIWQFTHDESIYHEPYTFNPERFLGRDNHPPETDPYSLVFGYGRRICPGRELADSSLFISIAMLIAAFDISKAKGDANRDIEPLCEYTAGTISRPQAFQCTILPRSEKTRKLIEDVQEEAFQSYEDKQNDVDGLHLYF